jgi:hypothetical protein
MSSVRPKQSPVHAHRRRRSSPSKNKTGLTIFTQQRPHTYNNQPYLPNGAAGGHTGLPPGAAPLLPNNGRVIQTGGVRVLCIADVRGTYTPIYVRMQSLTNKRQSQVPQRTCKAGAR